MKFLELLHQRDALLQQARLANVAFAYRWLERFGARLQRARLRGAVVLRDGDSDDGLPWPTLEMLEESQAVWEEHFLEEDVLELMDILSFLKDGHRPAEMRFSLEDVAARLVPGLRRELEQAGVLPRAPDAAAADAARDAEKSPEH